MAAEMVEAGTQINFIHQKTDKITQEAELEAEVLIKALALILEQVALG